MVAALQPALTSVWTTHGIRAVTLIGHHRGAWQLANWMFAAGIGFTLAGLAALTGLLNRHSPGSPLPVVALTIAEVASALWIANLTFRLTTTVRVADIVSGAA